MEPVTRVRLLRRKAEKDEEKQRKQVAEVVKVIYTSALTHAETNTNCTSFTFELQRVGHYQNFTPQNIEEIVEKLRELFPDSSLKYTKCIRDKFGKSVDITNIDPKLVDILGGKQPHECIVIDWS